MITDEDTKLILTAVGNVLQRKIAGVTPGAHRFEFPAPTITVVEKPPNINNEIHLPQSEPIVNVTIDMGPIATAIDRQTEAMSVQAKALEKQSIILGQLIQLLPSLIMKPEVHVDVASPQVTFQPPDPIEAMTGPKRKLRITHDDGSNSTIEEI